RETFSLQLVVQRRIEPNEIAALLCASEALGGRGLDQQRLRRKLDPLSADLGMLRLTSRCGGGHRSRVRRGEVISNRRDQLAVALAEQRQVRLDSVRHELGVAREDL